MYRDTEQVPDPSIIDAATRQAIEERIDQSLWILTSIESDIIKLRYGLTDGCIHSCEEIGEQMDIAPERVAVIETRAVAKLRSSEQLA